MAGAPALLESYLAVAKLFDTTDLSHTERQIILMTNNRINDCGYCMAAHTTISQMVGVPAEVVDALRDGTPLADPKLEALRVFAAAVNTTRGWPTEAELEAFFAAGYTHQSVLEVILGTSMKLMSNYTNHITGTEVDAAFAPNAWSKDAAVV